MKRLVSLLVLLAARARLRTRSTAKSMEPGRRSPPSANSAAGTLRRLVASPINL